MDIDMSCVGLTKSTPTNVLLAERCGITLTLEGTETVTKISN